LFIQARYDLFNSNNLRDLERKINVDFYQKALPFIISKGIENAPWNMYFLMQHYKVRTRLPEATYPEMLLTGQQQKIPNCSRSIPAALVSHIRNLRI